MNNPRVMTESREATRAVMDLKAAGKRIGLVPTMGALHEGHLSLLRIARETCDVVVASIFVNPAQFGPTEDLDQYPRTLEQDLTVLAELGVELVYHPSNEEIYPPGFSTFVVPPRVANDLEGQCRPGHFRGVATVVLKLFQILPADVAFFGRKDYQQWLVVEDMVRDLHVPSLIQVCPTISEQDGLAMSSRNRYLQSQERSQALAIPQSLQEALSHYQAGERDPTVLELRAKEKLAAAGIDHVYYVAVRCATTLKPLTRPEQPAVMLIAAKVGSTRLIDNQLLSSHD